MSLSPATLLPLASRPPAQRFAIGCALAAAGAALAWPGGLLALVGTALAAFGTLLAFQGQASQVPADDGATTDETAPDARAPSSRRAGRVGADLMVQEVVPVWSRQINVTRDAAAEGLSSILELFSQISGSLNELVENIRGYAVSAEPGAVDQAVRRESPALEALLSASRRAFEQRDAAVAELNHCADALVQMQHLAKQTRELARHTRLVAFNASIEANRGKGGSTSSDNGSQAVAGELRTLASRMAEAGEHVDRVVSGLLASTRKARRAGEIGDTSDDELRLELDLKAREALAALLGSMGAALQGSQSVQDASRQLSEQIEGVFVHFQFGDRISQMLSIVANDMDNFTRWVAEHPRAQQADAVSWLANLEASYTMEEQRSTHHGNVHVEQGAAVEFF